MSTDENVVYIGRKPIINYVLAAITHFNTPDAHGIVLKARGRSISTDVDVAEITRRRFMGKLQVENVEIGTEELTEENGRLQGVSTIEIDLKLI